MQKLLTRNDAVGLLEPYIGIDLRSEANRLGVTVFKEGGGFNKGWAGQTIELMLGLGINSKQAPDGDDLEVKAIPLQVKHGQWVTKETMAVTMINADEVPMTEFEDSHLWQKLRKLLICARQ